MMELNGEPTTRRWLPSHVYPDANTAQSRMQYLISCYTSPGDPRSGPYVLAVEHIASGALLGHVGFSPFNGEVEVSYAIAESARGRGYGTDALLCACRWAAEQFNLASILAITESENTPSRRTLERATFVHDEDEIMQFQGSQQRVSRYLWHRQAGRAE
jgi:RimJ/RimL family protein N-acetyltransferase